MTRLLRALATVLRRLAVVTLMGLLVLGVPIGLWTQVGWPLPHTLPTAEQLLNGLTVPLPDTVIPNVLAVVCWLAWAQLTLGLVVETVAQLRDRAAPRLRLTGPMQALAARLVGAAMVTALTLPTRVTPEPAPPPVVSAALLPSAYPVAALTPDPDNAPEPPSSQQEEDCVVYTVQPRDTAWGLAETYGGDGLRWRQLWELNKDRLQPDGDRWTDPGLLRPGWRLIFPEGWEQPPATPDPHQQQPESGQEPPEAAPSNPPPTTPPDTTGPNTTTPPPPDAPPPDDQNPGQEHTDDPVGVVRLPSGSLVWMSLAFSVLVLLEIARRRRRRHRLPAEPTPGIHRTGQDDRADPTVRWLESLARQPADPASQDHTPESEPATDAPPQQISDRIEQQLADLPHRSHLGPIPIATRHGTEVTLDLAESGGLSLSGPGAPGVARAITTAVLTTAGQVEVLLVGDTLLGRIEAFPGMRRYGQLGDALRELEVEIVRRTRLLDRTQTATLSELHAADPAEPAPFLLLVAPQETTGQVARLRTLLGLGQRLGVAAVLLDAQEPLGAHLEVTAASTMATGQPAELTQQLGDATLFTLTVQDATAVLGTVAAARTDDPAPPPVSQPPATQPSEPPVAEPLSGMLDAPADAATPTQPSEPVTIPVRAPGSPPPMVQVSVLGGFQILAGGTEVTSGMRRTAYELLLYFLLHPSGASLATVVATVWPDTRLGRESDQWWNALSSLRRELRKATGDADLAIIQHYEDDDSYRIDPEIVDCDLWHFQAALEQANQAADDLGTVRALTQAADAYRGELASGDYEWADPDRQSLRATAVDALTQLAQLRETAGDLDGAIAALTQATEADPTAEEVYRRLMRLQATHEGIEKAERTYRRLETRLEELDADVDPATAQLRQELTRAHQRQQRRRARSTSKPRSPASRAPAQPPEQERRSP